MDLLFEKSEALPKATRLSFKVIGDIPADLDVRDLLEEPLSQLGVLEVGQMIPIPILEGTMLLLQECEPDNIVFLDGEADLEIENDSVPQEQAASAAAQAQEGQAQEGQVPLPNPEYAPFTQDIDFSSMLPPSSPAPSGFVPFSGIGRTLGGR